MLPTPPDNVVDVYIKEKEKARKIKLEARRAAQNPPKPPPAKETEKSKVPEKKTPAKTPLVFDNKYMVEVGGKYIDMRKPPISLTLGEMEILLDRLRIMEEKDVVEQQLDFIVRHLTNLGVEEEHVNNLLKYGTKIPLKSREEIEKMYAKDLLKNCLLYTSPSPRDRTRSRMPSSA